jgi:phage terminase large subunit-like protein
MGRSSVHKREGSSPVSISLAERLAQQGDDAIDNFVATLPPDEQSRVLHEWEFWARPDQIAPDYSDAWLAWLLRGGRGLGKTRTGAETTHDWAERSEAIFSVPSTRLRLGLVARTAADARDTMVEGESGIIATAKPWNPVHYEPSKRRITWKNGARATLYTGDEPDALRGPQHHAVWADEMASWRFLERAWSNLMFGLRLPSRPTLLVTTTPRPVKELTELLARDSTIDVRVSSFANRANLDPVFFNTVIRPYIGTRLGRQEIEGELLADREGALWTHELIDQARIPALPTEIDRPVQGQPGKVERVPFRMEYLGIGVDPSGSADGDEIGIVAAGRGNDGHFYVVHDRSGRMTPQQWGAVVVNLYGEIKADRVYGEGNFGGDMVESNIRSAAGGRAVAYRKVTASRGKAVRAEPVAALYERGLVHHVGAFPDLEDQMCGWAPGDPISPDRMDALVWVLSEIKDSGGLGVW